MAALKMAKTATLSAAAKSRGQRRRGVERSGGLDRKQPAWDALFPGRTLLACIDGSEWPLQALRYLLQSPRERATLLYVSPSPGEGYVECGWMALEAAMHRCRLYAPHLPLHCRLEVGDPASRITAVCREERPDVLALVSHARAEAPAGSAACEVARGVASANPCHVLLASPRGTELLAGEERLLITPRFAGARLPAALELTSLAAVSALPLGQERDAGGQGDERFSRKWEMTAFGRARRAQALPEGAE